MISNPTAKRAVFASVAAILILTVLEFPPPIGFESRPQSGVSPFWLLFFLVILIVEVATVPLIYKRPNLGRAFGITAAFLNVAQVVADQTHLMQPEVAPFGYSLLEGTVVVVSIALAIFSWMVKPERELRPLTTKERLVSAKKITSEVNTDAKI